MFTQTPPRQASASPQQARLPWPAYEQSWFSGVHGVPSLGRAVGHAGAGPELVSHCQVLGPPEASVEQLPPGLPAGHAHSQRASG